MRRYKSKSRGFKKKGYKRKRSKSFKRGKRAIPRRVKKLEKAVRKLRPEHKENYDANLNAQVVTEGISEATPTGAIWGQAENILGVPSGFNVNERVGDSVSKMYSVIDFVVTPQGPSALYDLSGNVVPYRRIRFIAIQWTSADLTLRDSGEVFGPPKGYFGLFEAPVLTDWKQQKVGVVLLDKTFRYAEAVEQFAPHAAVSNDYIFKSRKLQVKLVLALKGKVKWNGPNVGDLCRPVTVWCISDGVGGVFGRPTVTLYSVRNHFWDDS